MNPLDTIKNIINKGKAGVLFQSPNPLLRAVPAKPKTPVVFGIPTKPTATPTVPSTANTTRQTVSPVPMQAPVVPPLPINPIDIIRNGKTAVIRAPQGSEATTTVRKDTILNRALFGSEQDRKAQADIESRGGKVPFTAKMTSGGILGTIAPSFARTAKERQEATSQALIEKGIDPNRAIEIAYQKDMSNGALIKTPDEMKRSKEAEKALEALNLTPEEKNVLLVRKVLDAGETALDATTFGVGGTVRNVGKGAIKTVLKGKELDIAEQAIDIARGTSKLDKEVQAEVMKKAQDIADREQFPNRVSGVKSLANDFEAVLQNKPAKAEPLQEEAKKYKSAEEFANTVPSDVLDKLREQGIRGGEQRMKFWEDAMSSKADDTYKMSHRPTDGVRAFDLTEMVDGEQMIPKDMYTQWYGSRGTKEDLESISALKAIKGKPEAEITIYRASPKSDFNEGDWVTFSKSYAQTHADGNGTKVWSKKVKAKDVRWAMDDINEFGYWPTQPIGLSVKRVTDDATLTDVGRANKLAEEAKKYKSADEFVYRGGLPLSSKLVADDGISFSRNKKTASKYAGTKSSGTVRDYSISPDTKLYRPELTTDIDGIVIWNGKKLTTGVQKEILDIAKKEGFDGVDFGPQWFDEVRVINTEKILPKKLDEYVNLQGTPVYHGSDNTIKEFGVSNSGRKDFGAGAYFYADKVDTTRFGKVTNEAFISPKARIDEFTSQEWRDMESQLGQQWGSYKDEYKNFGDFITYFFKENGVDGVKITGGKGSDLTVIYNPDIIKTKSQLTDIYNKANAKPAPVTTKQKPNKMADYRAGKPNSEGGYIQNPLAGKGETPKSNNQVVSSGNDSIKPKSALVSYETKLQQRVDLLRQVPNKNARVQRELAKKSWKLSDLMTKKAARNEKLSEVRDTKIVDRGVKDRIKLASSAGETRSLSKLAEEQGLYETQQRNLTPEMLEKRRFEIQMEQEALDADPVSELSQFVAKRGEFKGTLPEHATTKSGFGLDERVTGAGFDSTEEARQAYDLYKQRKANLLEKKKILADDIRIARNEKNTEQSFARKVSPIESLTKRVATNASRITKRVEQKVAARQVQFEKREARRQVIKAKAELIDKMRKSSSEITAVKSDIVEYAKNNLPTSQVGKFISVVKNATNRRQAVQAFNRIDNLVTEIEKKTLIRDIQKSVANLPASVEIGYATKIKELVSDINLKGYSKATVQKLEETQKYLIEQKKLGKDVELPSRLLEKLQILGRTDAKNLTVSQLQGIQDEIELLKHLGKTKQRIKTNLYEAEKAYIAEDLISTAKPLTYREIKTTPGVAQTLGIKTANKVKQVLNRLKKARMSLRPIDGLAEATGMEQVKNRIDLSYSNYLDKLDNFAKQREEIVDRLKLKDTNMERIGIYAAKQQDGGYEKLANLGITEQAADAIKLTDAEQEYYEFGRKMFDEDFDEVKAYMQDVYNKDVGKVDNYVSFQTDFNAMSELEIYDRFGTLADDAVTRTKTVKKDFTESRTGSGGQKIKLNFDSILIRHKDNVSYMLNLGKDIKMYSEVLNDPTLRTKLGDLGTFAWKEYMSLMARKGGVDSQKQIATIDMLRRNLGVGVMAYKLSTALVQVSSLADAAATIGSKWVSIGVYDIASNREARKFIIDNFPEIREMIGDDIAFLELGDDWLGKVQQAGFIPLRKLDALMRSTSAVAAYKKLASDAGITVDFAKPNKDLIQKATKLVRQSQGSSSFKDSPLALTTGSFTGNVSVDKAIFQFQSFMLNRWENIERQIWREGFGSGNYVKGFTAVFWMVVAAGIIEESSRRVSRGAVSLITGEDKEEDPFIETVIGNTTKNVPIAGNIMNSLAYDSNPVPFINAAETTLGGYKRAFTGVETSTKAKGAVDATLGTANLLFGIPGTVQAGQLIKPFIGERDGSGNKELDETIKDSKEKEKNRSKDAEAMLVSLKSLPPDRANAVMKELKINDEAMFNKVKALKQAEDLNWSKEEKAIANLGVTDGTKARYVYSQVNKLGTAEEKNAYLKELLDRKIISKEVLKQIKDLKEGGKNNDIIE